MLVNEYTFLKFVFLFPEGKLSIFLKKKYDIVYTTLMES